MISTYILVFHNISISLHVPHRVQDGLSFGDIIMQEDLTVISIEISVDLLAGSV